MAMRTHRIAAALAALLALAAGCTSGDGDDAGDKVSAPAVTLEEFAIAPAEIHVPEHTAVTVAITNAGALAHNLSVRDVATSEDIGAGGTGSLEIPALEAGSYALLCTIEGHETAGMAGTLVVGEDDAAAQPESTAMSAEEMARMHVAGVKAFPAKTKGTGNVLLEPVIAADGTKVFDLTADEIDWETEPGTIKAGYAFNGQIPGPRIEVDRGDKVRVVLHNRLDDAPTAIHYHGLLVPNAMDGVPGLTQDPVMPGEDFTYEFTVRNGGSHMYHSHFDAAKQVPMGLLGAFIVHEPGEAKADVDEVMVLNDGPLGFTLNGKGFPATQPIAAKLGQKVRVRYMNEGLMIHPMHLHGMPQRVVARDGYPLERPYLADTVLVGPGERIDVEIDATEPGAWAYHCHILNHAEAADGMFGMVTALIVE